MEVPVKIEEQPPVAKSSSEPGPSSDMSGELAALKAADEDLKKKVEESNG